MTLFCSRAFVLKYPAIELEVDLSRASSTSSANFDVAIRMGDLRDDASLAARRLAVFTGSLYAAPAYVERRGMPSEPEALIEHDALRLLGRTGEPRPWVLTRGDARLEGIPPGRATANSPELLMRMALAGAGITTISDHFVLPYLMRRELVQVLPDWRTPPVSAWAVFPGRRLMPTRTRALLDALAAKFTGKEWRRSSRKYRRPRHAFVRRLDCQLNLPTVTVVAPRRPAYTRRVVDRRMTSSGGNHAVLDRPLRAEDPDHLRAARRGLS